MIAPPIGTRIWIVAGATDMRRGFDGLAALVQTQLEADPFSGQIFVFRGRRGDRIKLLWWDGDGLCLFCKRLEQGRFVWPQATSGSVSDRCAPHRYEQSDVQRLRTPVTSRHDLRDRLPS